MPKLLIVDDEPNVLYSLQTGLESEDLEVVTARTAKLGLAAVAAERPDVALVDVRLPDLSGRDLSGPATDVVEDRVDRALADRRAAGIDAAHAGLRREWDERRCKLSHVAAADAVFFLGQHHDRAALGGLVGKRGELRRVRQFLFGNAADRAEGGRRARGRFPPPTASRARTAADDRSGPSCR